MINELIEQFIKEDYEEFKIALTHSSFVNENNDKNIQSNERLEYLGDSVISYAVSNYLYHTYPTIAEGELSKIRSEIVNQKSLSEFSKSLDLGSYLILGKGEELNNGRNKTSTLCNLFEAVIGYMSIEIGINKTEKLLIDLFKEKIETIYNSKSFYDSKSLLQEKLQEEGIDLPDYVSSELEDGNFNVDLFIQNKLITSTKARRKIDAEKYAAQIALDTYINQDDR
ncbi:MAG: ribonuclease III [Chloroflexi bacterium]|nr:ribonuclease III [Chloroflexota bacterium]|tara:strand:- start:440 stop:1117 length:678 start_codon:yes stop_codon:yes gene_type:complete